MCLLNVAACTRATEPTGSPSRTADGSAAVDVVFDAGTAHQTIAGFGSSERVFDDPHLTETFDQRTRRSAVVLSAAEQDEIFDMLYRELGLTRVRPAAPDIGDGGGIEPVNDNGDPDVMNLSKFDFQWKNLDDHCRYAAKAGEKGAKTFFLSPLNRERWMGVQSGDAAEYAEWLLAMILRCKELGVESPYVSVANEPSFERNHMSGEFIRDVILVLGPKLRSAGLSTMVVVPDDIRSSNAAKLARTVLENPRARPYVGALATHLYDEPVGRLKGMEALSKQYGLPLWMTEFSLSLASSAGVGRNAFDWANLMHDLLANYDVSAIDYQWGAFGEWESGSQLVVLEHDRSNRYVGARRNKEYYVTGQYSRYVRPGFQRIAASSPDPDVKVTAYRNGDALVLVALNNAKSSKTVAVNVQGMAAPQQLHGSRTTSGDENWADLSPIEPVKGQFTATLPPLSITTLAAERP